MTKFMNKYRIESTRLQSWDYGNNGAYFITICTKKRKHFFGNILDGEMHLSEIGLLAEKHWLEIPQHFPFVSLGNFVVMPDHTHGIPIINKLDIETPNLGVSPMETPKPNLDIREETPNLGVSVETVETPKPKNGGKNPKWKPNSIGSIINQYKRVVTINARKIQKNFGWQSLFHDYIIRNAQQYENINNYIAKNPANWGKKKEQK